MEIDWGVVITTAISWIITTSIAALCGWLSGSKKSVDYIGRKENIYQPLVDELDKISSYDIDVLHPIKIGFIGEVVENNYKYALDDVAENKLKQLIQLIQYIEMFNGIRLEVVAHNVLVKQFKRGFESLYGSVIDGYSSHIDEYGNEYEIEHKMPEYVYMYQTDWKDQIIHLLNDGDHPSNYVLLPSGERDAINDTLVNIFNSALSATYDNGEKSKRKMLIEWLDTPGSYIAYHSDFTKDLENEDQWIKKYQLREEIILLAQGLGQKYKEHIAKIVSKYEKEQI